MDVRKGPPRGGSAILVAEDEALRVSTGSLGAFVEFKALRLEVQMDESEGDWTDLDWACSQALGVLGTPDLLLELLWRMCTKHRVAGQRAGANALRKQLRDLLQDEH